MLINNRESHTTRSCLKMVHVLLLDNRDSFIDNLVEQLKKIQKSCCRLSQYYRY